MSMTRVALGLRHATSPDATIATGAAGEIGYFSQRQTYDLLGYSDAVVAREAPRPIRYIPGHNKWDFAYSVGKLRPDLVFDIFPADTPAYIQQIQSYGYIRLGPQLYVRDGTPTVDRAALAEVVLELNLG
jgi:hypothetical protein